MRVHVHFHIKDLSIEAFKKASMDNAQNSRLEPGVLGFEVLQQQDDPSRFLFVERYKSPEDQLLHRETEHFKRWRSCISEMLSEPYTFTKYEEL
ncbi:MAG: antibiotic biosynthesis monooxygenase [Clostridia bacterium]|nr:antibiotic biosynthesis monooxygenase [Clostridia bacterium]